MAIETTPHFWDCECEQDYIHPSTDTDCDRCQAKKDDSPDSRVTEVSKQWR